MVLAVLEVSDTRYRKLSDFRDTFVRILRVSLLSSDCWLIGLRCEIFISQHNKYFWTLDWFGYRKSYNSITRRGLRVSDEQCQPCEIVMLGRSAAAAALRWAVHSQQNYIQTWKFLCQYHKLKNYLSSCIKCVVQIPHANGFLISWKIHNSEHYIVRYFAQFLFNT